MALHDDVVEDATRHGGLIRFDGWEATEGSDWRIETPGSLGLEDGSAMNWTTMTSVTAAVIDENEASVVALTWVPSADGSFALTAAAASTVGLAGTLASSRKGRRLRFFCVGTLPDGRKLQIVSGDSTIIVKQKGN